MKHFIYFIYFSEPTCVRECDDGDVEGEIRYWLTKSPGMYEIDEILVIPESEKKDWMFVKRKMDEEVLKYEQERRERHERSEFERLKKKFDAIL